MYHKDIVIVKIVNIYHTIVIVSIQIKQNKTVSIVDNDFFRG